MSWFKVDDTLHTHPKSRRAGLPAMGLWTICGSYCMSYKTDGFVPDWFVIQWPQGRKRADELVTAGMWEAVCRNGETGWQYHDWHHYQPSASEIEETRERARERQRKHRERQRGNTDVTGDETRDERDGHASSDGSPTRPDPSRPVLGVLRSVDGGSANPNRHLGDAPDRDEIGLG